MITFKRLMGMVQGLLWLGVCCWGWWMCFRGLADHGNPASWAFAVIGTLGLVMCIMTMREAWGKEEL